MSRDNISGKSILLVIEPFYGYGLIIKDELIKLGAKSVYLKTADFLKGSFRDGINLRKAKEYIMYPHHRSEWTKSFIKEIDGMDFDTLFVVENMPFKKSFLSMLRKKNPDIRMILFLWDKFSTQQPYYFDYLPLFDVIYSFDRDDAAKYGLRYYPDFYIEKEVLPIEECKYDLLFVGAMNTTSTLFRGKLLEKIQEIVNRNKLSYFFYLRYTPITLSKNVLLKIRTKLLFFKYLRTINELSSCDFLKSGAMPISMFNQLISSSRIILDLSYRNRQGLTINAITALALGKKLITTNKRIVDEPFFDSSRVYVIDDKNPELSLDFLRGKYKSIDMTYLRLDNWLKHVVNENE